jgi:hypothetical protein
MSANQDALNIALAANTSRRGAILLLQGRAIK